MEQLVSNRHLRSRVAVVLGNPRDAIGAPTERFASPQAIFSPDRMLQAGLNVAEIDIEGCANGESRDQRSTQAGNSHELQVPCRKRNYWVVGKILVDNALMDSRLLTLERR